MTNSPSSVQSESTSVPPSVAPALAASSSALPPAEGGALIKVEPLELKAPDGRLSMRQVLATTEAGQVYLREAQDLASNTTLITSQAIFDHIQEAQQALSGISNQILGDRTIGKAGPIGELFSGLQEIHTALDISAINRPKSNFEKLAAYVTEYFEPVVAFARRFQEIKPQLDQKEQTLITFEAESIERQNNLKALKQTIVNGFRKVEVAIAAGEEVLDRERDNYTADAEELKETPDMIARQELKDRRTSLMNFDNRILRLQVARGDSLMDLPMIDTMLDNEVKLQSTVKDLREITIPQLRKAVVLAVMIYDQGLAADVAGGVQKFNDLVRNANLDLLGIGVEKTHELAISASKEAHLLVACMDKLGGILTRSNELLLENRDLNENARVALDEGEKRLKKNLELALKDDEI